MAANVHAARPLPLFVEVLGWLALLTAVALMSPGVVTQASAEPSEATVADGPSCSAAEAGADRLAIQVEQHIAQLRAQVEARPGEADADGVIPLNNSGFNYRPEPPAAAQPAEPQPE